MPSADSGQTRFELVRKRLLWAKKIWVGKGLVGRESETPIMRQIIEFYRSNQWQSKGSFGDLPGDVLRVVNKVFPTANRQQAGIASRNPRVQYFPRREQDRKSAPMAEALHNYGIREQNHIEQLNSALRYGQFAPFPFVMRHGYTPEKELKDKSGKTLHYYKHAHPNRPWIKAMAPWNVLIDPRGESFESDGGAQWCAFRSVSTIDQIRRNPNMIAREKLRDFTGNINRDWSEMIPDELLAQEDPEHNQYAEVWSYYDLEDRTWMQLTLDGVDDWLRKPGEWPIPWEWLPMNAVSVNPQIDTPFPVSLLEAMIPLQEEKNQVRTMMSLLARAIRRIVGVNKNLVDEDILTLLKDGALVEFFELKGPAPDAIAQIQIGGFPQELLLYDAKIDDDIREAVGLSLYARAQRENVESATEAANIQAGQDVIEGRTQAAFDRFVREVEITWMQGLRAVLAETGAQEVLRVLGPEGVAPLEQFLTVDAETIAGEFEFEIEAGSTRPRDKDREAQMAAVDMQIAAAVPFAKLDQFFRDWLEKRTKDPARYMEKDSAMASAVQRGSNVLRGAGADVGEAPSIDANTLGLIARAGGNGSAQ